MAPAVRLLFLAANPPSMPPLRLDKEVREIETKIRAAGGLYLLNVTSRWAVRPDDLLQYLNEHRPHIVHFCGHGRVDESLVLEDDAGVAKAVSKEALAHLFAVAKDNVRLVVFNACYSEPHAREITRHIDAAIGMCGSVGDRAAVEFAASFYRALSFGRSVDDALQQGKVALELQGLSGADQPRLHLRQGVNARNLTLVQAPLPPNPT
jgi:CHAT domain-containing protein